MKAEKNIPDKIAVDKNGFYVDANGQQRFLVDEAGRCVIPFSDGASMEIVFPKAAFHLWRSG
jgi:hypothetical protein